MAAFVESLEMRRNEKQSSIDPRIIRFLTSELEQRKVQTEGLSALLEELTRSVPSFSEAGDFIEHKEQMEQKKAKEKEEKIEKEVEASVEDVLQNQNKEAIERKAESLTGAFAERKEEKEEEKEKRGEEKGRYVYGIAAGGKEIILGAIGIEGNEVYTIPYQDICAIVHNCPSEPYQSNDDEIVKDWARAHQNVLDEAKKILDTIIPLGFDTILQPKDNAISPNQLVRDWLKEDYDRLSGLMQKIEGKDEYSVQISYEQTAISKKISEQSEEIKKIKEEMATKSPGLAYMYRQKLEQAAKAEMEKLADEWFRDFYGSIKKHTDDIVVEKTKKLDKEKVMLLNLSCLVSKDKVEDLGEELERINNMEGFSVRFTGPWPAYSFVSKPAIEGA
jgi:hypothetical protein